MACRREKQISRRRSFLKKPCHAANRWVPAGDLWSRPAKSPRAKSSEAKSSKLAGQLAPTNMIAMIEPHAGATCASGHHQNADDDAEALLPSKPVDGGCDRSPSQRFSRRRLVDRSLCRESPCCREPDSARDCTDVVCDAGPGAPISEPDGGLPPLRGHAVPRSQPATRLTLPVVSER